MKIVKRIAGLLLLSVVIAATAFAAFWFSRPADVSFAELKATIPHASYSKFAEIDGVKLHYQEKGAGTPVVLIHGYTSSTYTWKDLFIPLSEKFRVIAVDLKGFGFSEKPDGDYTRREQARLIKGLLEHLQIEPAWLVGNSMGGETALNLALANPERVRGLILIDSAGVRFEARSGFTPWYIRLPFVGRALSALALTSDGLVRAGLEKSFYDDQQITEEQIRYYHQPLKTDGGQLAAMRARQQFAEHPVENRLGEIDRPALLLWGKEDEVIPLSAGQKMNSLIRDSEIKIYESVGHLPQEESPERVLSDIIDFIERSEKSSEN
jgi:pimeloyl-ACP methyl ester carboxylesterase